MAPLGAVSTLSDPEPDEAGQMERADAILETEYEAVKLDDGVYPWLLDTNLTLMCPVKAETAPGKVDPLNGLPASSLVESHVAVVHEYSLTVSRSRGVLKLEKESVTALPGDEITSEQESPL